jgi:glycosyltransferase involved in cell wall biosynthesis
MRKFVKLKKVTDRVCRAVAVMRTNTANSVPEGFIALPPDIAEKDAVGMWLVDGKWTKDSPFFNRERLDNFTSGKTGVRFTAPFLDGSGYAEAGRNYVAALRTVGVAVKANPISFESARSDYGRAGKMVEPALNAAIEYGVNITFLTPDHFPLYKESGKYNIGMFDWETDALPVEWVSACNEMHEVWVPCQWTAKVCRQSGVHRPIYVFGHCATPEDFDNPKPLPLPELAGLFKFYSVFQWTERKNPRGLLLAYFNAFKASDPVVLVLKTYRCDYSDSERRTVVEEIANIMVETGRDDLPRVHLIPDMLTREQMVGLHAAGDCFVLIHRSEGWGLPIFEACMMGTPVITTNFSANLEFTTKDNSYLVDARPSKVFGMPWIPWYRDHMHWSDPDLGMCAKAMQAVYQNRAEAVRRAVKAKELVRKKFTWESVGSAIKARLVEILSVCEF